jgi:hypothetical protein
MEEVTAVSAELVRWGIFFTALLLALGVAAGWLEAELGVALDLPALHVAPRLRIPILVLCLVVAVSAIAISNAVVDALF